MKSPTHGLHLPRRATRRTPLTPVSVMLCLMSIHGYLRRLLEGAPETPAPSRSERREVLRALDEIDVYMRAACTVAFSHSDEFETAVTLFRKKLGECAPDEEPPP